MQADGRPSVVKLKSQYSRYEERVGLGEIKPGFLLDLNASNQVIPHGGAAGANVARRFATEELLTYEGKTIADVYATTALVSYREFLPGDELQAWLASGESVAIDDKLESAGDGTLQALTTGDAVAQAIEVVDATSASKMIKVIVS